MATSERSHADTGWVVAKSAKEATELGWGGESYSKVEVALSHFDDLSEDEQEAHDIYRVEIKTERVPWSSIAGIRAKKEGAQMAKQPSAETQLRYARQDAKRLRDNLNRQENITNVAHRKAMHYEQILSAIAAGHYPDGQASLAAKHALEAMKGGA